jgi:LemA protein
MWSMTPLTLAALFAVIVVAAIIGFLGVTTYNDVVALRNRAAKAWANVDVALKQRHDELPNYVNAVRGVMQFEREVLTEVTERRAAYSDRDSIPKQAATSEATSAAVRQLFAVVERYPEVKSAANVAALQAEIARLEDLIADRRELYNDQVYRYNTRIAQLPANLLTGLLGWRPLEFFAVGGDERERPEVDLAVG